MDKEAIRLEFYRQDVEDYLRRNLGLPIYPLSDGELTGPSGGAVIAECGTPEEHSEILFGAFVESQGLEFLNKAGRVLLFQL